MTSSCLLEEVYSPTPTSSLLAHPLILFSSESLALPKLMFVYFLSSSQNDSVVEEAGSSISLTAVSPKPTILPDTQ